MKRPLPARPGIDILLEDEFLIALNKPAGIAVLADRGGEVSLLDLLRARLKAKGETGYVVHRVDKGTSGALLFGKTKTDARELSRQFEQREVEKRYLVLVGGVLREPSGSIDLPLFPRAGAPLRMGIREVSKPSLTEYRLLEQFRTAAFLEVIPRTGRTHQIRAHLQAIGHPLLVDPVYGGGEALFLSGFKRGYRRRTDRPESPLLDRLSLHAARLSFRHPRTGVGTTVGAPLPKDFAMALRQLRKYAV